jgi:hypothetical protein
MKSKIILGLALVLGVGRLTAAEEKNIMSQPPGVVNQFPQPDRIRYDGHCLTIDGQDRVALDANTPMALKSNGIQPKDHQDALFTWYRLEFELPATPAGQWISWRLLINASGNGFMWLNDHDIGKHWEAGPQREFYLPECWLKYGKGQKNVIVLGLRQTINGATLKAAEVSPYPDAAELIQ